MVPAQSVQQCRQREQIRNTKRRPTRGNPHKRIHGRGAGPGLTNSTQRPVIARVMDPLHAQARPALNQFELASVKRMKRVRYPKAPSLDVSMGCS